MFMSREYICYGSYGGINLYRYSIGQGTWTVDAIPFFPVDDGGMAWLPSPVPGVYLIQGEMGSGFARLWLEVTFLGVQPISGTIAAGGSQDLSVLFDATVLQGGLYEAEIQVSSNDPSTQVVTVPVTLEVTGAPDKHAPRRPPEKTEGIGRHAALLIVLVR